MSNSMMVENTGYAAGAIATVAGGDIAVTNSTFIGNVGAFAGAMYLAGLWGPTSCSGYKNDGGTFTESNNHFSDNTCTFASGLGSGKLQSFTPAVGLCASGKGNTGVCKPSCQGNGKSISC